MASPPPSAPKDALVDRSILRITTPGARALVSAALAATILISTSPLTPAAAALPREAAQVIAIQQVYAPFFASSEQQMTIGDGQRTA